MILEGAIIEKGAVIAANSVIPPGRVVPAQQVWGGNPIKFIRHAKDQEKFVTKNLANEIATLTFGQNPFYKHHRSTACRQCALA